MHQMNAHNLQLDPRRVDWGEAFDELKSNPYMKKLFDLEEVVMKELALFLTQLHPSETPNYESTVAHNAGMVAGIRKLREYRENCLGEYQLLLAKEKQGARNESPKSVEKKPIY